MSRARRKRFAGHVAVSQNVRITATCLDCEGIFHGPLATCITDSVRLDLFVVDSDELHCFDRITLARIPARQTGVDVGFPMDVKPGARPS